MKNINRFYWIERLAPFSFTPGSRSIIISLITIMFSGQLVAQNQRTKLDYVNIVKIFYLYLYSDISTTSKDCYSLFGEEGIAELEEMMYFTNCTKRHIDTDKCSVFFKQYSLGDSPSLYFLKIKEHVLELTQNLKKYELFKIIDDSSSLLDVLAPSYVLLKVSFPNQHFLYFTFNKYSDEPAYMGAIFTSDGSSLDNNILQKRRLFLEIPGSISNQDSFINVRKLPDSKSSIVGVLNRKEHFSFMPTNNSIWWKIRREKSAKVMGYVLYYQVLPLGTVER